MACQQSDRFIVEWAVEVLRLRIKFCFLKHRFFIALISILFIVFHHKTLDV